MASVRCWQEVATLCIVNDHFWGGLLNLRLVALGGTKQKTEDCRRLMTLFFSGKW